MVRVRKTITLDEKIEKAQDAVEKAKVRYDAAVKELRVLLEKKDAQRKQELLKAVDRAVIKLLGLRVVIDEYDLRPFSVLHSNLPEFAPHRSCTV